MSGWRSCLHGVARLEYASTAVPITAHCRLRTSLQGGAVSRHLPASPALRVRARCARDSGARLAARLAPHRAPAEPGAGVVQQWWERNMLFIGSKHSFCKAGG